VIKEFWSGLGRAARLGLVAGAALILLGTAAVGYLLLRTEYQVLFADLAPQDGAAMVAELERAKVPYQLTEQGASGGVTILVDRQDVHRTRLKLMGKDLPLHGAVGFELFNNSDFGMTEFAQRINYQRALQGELTRTILALSEIRDARVLLALPEQALFKQATSRGKASVTLTLKPGQALRGEQVTGIQRLVSAAVPGIAFEDVTIVDQRGVALSRTTGDGDAGGGAVAGRFDLKRDTEQYLARKASEVLERTLGPGQALASVDVTLNMDRIQTTTEDVLGSPAAPGRAATGVVVRERDTRREVGAPLSGGAPDPAGGPIGGSSNREVEYAVGRKVEQVVSQPGSIRRLHVVAVVRRALDASQQAQIAIMVGASVGASPERGDSVVVQSMVALAGAAGASSAGVSSEPDPASGSWSGVASGARTARDLPEVAVPGVPPAAVLLVGLLAAAALATWPALRWRDRRRNHLREPETEQVGTTPKRPMSVEERQAALLQVQGWLRTGDAGRFPGMPS